MRIFATDERESYHLWSRRLKRRKRKRKLKFLLLFILLLIGIFLFSRQFKKEELAASTLIGSATHKEVQLKKASDLKGVVDSALLGTNGTYAVAIKNLKSGESYYLNEHRSFKAGSLYKLWIMIATFNQIKDGVLTEDQVLSKSIQTLNRVFDIDPELAEQKEGIITLSVADALKQMITISHNYAALLLTEKIKLSTVAKLLKEEGFSESQVGTDGDAPVTTASDISTFFEKLYKGELANQEYTDKMLTLLKDQHSQQSGDKLPEYLPEGTIIAHKTGELEWFSHDAGIIYSPSGDYIIVVLTETQSPEGANDRIAQVSKAVYEYVVKK